MSRSGPLRIAVIGCGAVTRANLMPVLAGHNGVSVAALVDRDRHRAAELAAAYGVSRVETDMDAALTDVDAVILATPPAHHAPATRAAAQAGKHVLVEKPMAITSADAIGMVDAARAANVALSVGLYRRMLPSVKLLATLIAEQTYGRVLSVDAEEGGPYGWQLASLDVLTRAAGGGGVLIDIGSHVLDVILHVVPGAATLTRYADNARGGIETDCELEFTIARDEAAVPVRVELSRTRELRGSIKVVFEHATLELRRPDFTQVIVHAKPTSSDGTAAPAKFHLTAEWNGQQPYIGYQAFRDEIDDWIDAIENGTEPVLSGRSVVPVVKLIEDCYRQPAVLDEPWTDETFSLPPRGAAAVRRRVLVTGAGGFLGGRTVEILQQRYGWDVVALVREPKGAARLARWPGEIAIGDVCSPADMDRVVKGCDAVVHCAVGTVWPPEAARKVTIDGTRIVAEAAQRAGVRRFVHISTFFVHRRDVDGVIDEHTPLEPPTADDYGQAKLAAEGALAEVTKRGLSTIVLRPVRIYGPFSRTFTIRPLQAIAEGRFAIAGDPNIPANMVYVDNVVEAIARAVEAGNDANGEGYLVADPEQVSLLQFYEAFADVVGQRVRVLPAADASHGDRPASGLAARWANGLKAVATSSELRGLVRRVFETDPIGTWPRRWWEASASRQQKLLKRFGADAAVIYRPSPVSSEGDLVYTGEAAHVSIDKARSGLGFDPPVSRDRAIELTTAWARYAHLLGQ
jgi:predicted dehydrogenase/nucleoside-diphosphate-sugar epimerase